MAPTDPTKRPFRLFMHPASSASLRVVLYLRCRGVPRALVELVSTGLRTDHRGIPVFTMPEGDAETARLGMTQTGPIIDYIEDCLPKGFGKPMMPEDPWLRAEARRIMWIVASDTQPYQNIPFIIQAIGEWGMVKATPTVHPLRLHFIRREFGALEGIMANCSGRFAVGDEITHADCFLAPQIRNALLAGIDLAGEFPVLSRVWNNLLATPEVMAVLEEAGGVVQPYAFDSEKFELYVNMARPAAANAPLDRTE
jgi:glutathione S-transferase